MIHSFRFRLVALSLLVSAAALLVFAGVAWTLITRDQGKRFDLELENLAAKFSPRLLNLALRGASTPNAPEARNQQLARDQLDASGAAYAVVTGNGRIALQSDSWTLPVDPANYAGHALPGNQPFQPQSPGDQFAGPNQGPNNFSQDNMPPDGQRGFRGNQRGGRRGGPQQQFFPDQGGQFPEGNGPNQGPGQPPNQPRAQMPVIRTDQMLFFSVAPPHPAWRLAVVPVGGGVILYALPLARLTDENAKARDTFLIALPVALGLVGLGAAWLASRAVAPVRKLSAVAGRITAEGLLERIPSDGEDTEFAQLINVFNAMLDRLARSFDQARRFSHDAAHELNTPLTVLMGQVDQALHAAPVGSLEQQRWAILAEEVQRLRDIVRKLLTLARADRGALRPDLQTVDLAKLIRDCSDDAAASAGDGLDFTVSGDESLLAEADPALLRQILYNLLSNATKYNRPGGFVKLHLYRESRDGQPWACLSVTNAGPAISPDQAAHVFDRFFRGDMVRPRTAEGLGLGLSLAREFARAHRGELSLANNAPDAVTLRLDLPALPPVT